jgi:hypoxanthine-guanine phosphoribosyltransferase
MKPLISPESIDARIREVGAELSAIYGEDEVVSVHVQKGSLSSPRPGRAWMQVTVDFLGASSTVSAPKLRRGQAEQDTSVPWRQEGYPL